MIVKTVVTYKNMRTVEPLASWVCIHTLYLSRPGTLQQIQNIKKWFVLLFSVHEKR